jgi:hypothetical protein
MNLAKIKLLNRPSDNNDPARSKNISQEARNGYIGIQTGTSGLSHFRGNTRDRIKIFKGAVPEDAQNRTRKFNNGIFKMPSWLGISSRQSE